MLKNKKLFVSLLLNVAAVAFEVVGFIDASYLGWVQFWFYTQISNLLLGIVSIVLIGYILCHMRDGIRIPAWLSFAKYCVTIMTTQTFLISLLVLSPMLGGIGMMMLGPIVRYFHTLCPLLAMVSFLIFDPKPMALTARHTRLAMLPTIVYGAVAILLNLLRVWHGPYPFLYVYEQPVWLSLVWLVVIMGAAFLIAFLLRIANQYLTREYVYK